MISGRGGQCLSAVAAGRPCDRLRTLGRADGGERTQQETLAEGAGASWRGRSVVRWVAQAPALLSGWKWNRSQPCQGAAELLFPGPAPGKMQGQSALRRAGNPSPQSEDPSLRVLVVTICSPRPIRAVQRAMLWAITCTASQAPLAAKRPEGRWFSPTPY